MSNKNKAVIISAIVVVLLLISVAIINLISNHSALDQTSYESEDQLLHSTQKAQDDSQELIKQFQKNNQQVIQQELMQLKSKPFTIAIYGSDARASEVSRSDVIMLVHYNPKLNDIAIISIPRDTRVNIPGKKVDKINHAYAFGGEELITKTLEELFDTKIDYYLVFKFTDFQAIIDKLGGVEVEAKKDYTYDPDEPVVPKGISVLTGEQALFYVRFRYDSEGDFGRIRRQQQVFRSLVQKFHDGEYNDWKQTIIQIYTEDLETNIDLNTVLNYSKLINISPEIKFENYMLETTGDKIDGIYYGIINEDSLENIKNRLNQE